MCGHTLRIKKQFSFLKHLKEDAGEDTAIVIVDFSENCNAKYARDTQGPTSELHNCKSRCTWVLRIFAINQFHSQQSLHRMHTDSMQYGHSCSRYSSTSRSVSLQLSTCTRGATVQICNTEITQFLVDGQDCANDLRWCHLEHARGRAW